MSSHPAKIIIFRNGCRLSCFVSFRISTDCWPVTLVNSRVSRCSKSSFAKMSISSVSLVYESCSCFCSSPLLPINVTERKSTICISNLFYIALGRYTSVASVACIVTVWVLPVMLSKFCFNRFVVCTYCNHGSAIYIYIDQTLHTNIITTHFFSNCE